MSPAPETGAAPASAPEPATRGPALGLLRRVAREPLVHFLLIGALMFAGLEAFQASRRPVVRIDAQDLEQLANYWQIQMQRPPNKDELRRIIDDRIDEELMAREALRLGLDKGDMIIRRRLAQKMAFATDDTAQASEPTDAELRAYYARTADRYAAPARVSFQQVFFSGDRPKGGAEDAANRALAIAEDDARDPQGDPFIFPLRYDDVSVQSLLRDYGPAVVKTLSTARVGAWTGPVLSPYGWHLVKVSARSEPRQASFEAVRAEVRDAFLADRRAQANADFLKSLRRRYRVVVADVPER